MGRAYTRPSVGQEKGIHFIERVRDPDDEFATKEVLSEDLTQWVPTAFNGPNGTITPEAFRSSSFATVALVRDAYMAGFDAAADAVYVVNPYG